MNEWIGEQAPDLSRPDQGAVEHGVGKKAVAAEQRRNNRYYHMDADDQGGNIDRVTSHPRDRPIIIGGSDSEHAFHLIPRIEPRKLPFGRCENLLGEARPAAEVCLSPIARSTSSHEQPCPCHFVAARHWRFPAGKSGGDRLGARGGTARQTGKRFLVRRFRTRTPLPSRAGA